jgi:hypothetical protein
MLAVSLQDASAYLAKYKEEYFELYHIHYNQYPDDTIENIYWLEKAAAADFCNPLYALALIEDKTQWEKYRNLFMMHINLKLTEQYTRLAEKWNKRHAYFYNAPWKEQNLKSLETAESCYNAAKQYWKEAVLYAEKVYKDKRFRFVNLERVQFWEDEAFRIENKKLNWGKTIDRELNLLQNVREEFLAMDKETY